MEKVFRPAEILLPGSSDLGRWAVLACDQFTSQPEYWQQAEEIVGGAQSTLRITLPEVYLEQPGVEARIEAIHTAMEEYFASTLKAAVANGYVYTERSFEDGSVRQGLVGAVDLEQYSYEPGADCAIRPSENTVVERIPPRLAVRRGAALETPHILMLVDDPAQSVIEPLAKGKADLPLLYDTELMLEGGRLQGWAVTEEAMLAAVDNALAGLADADRFRKLYQTDNLPFLMAVGDGNHSLATAKAYWEELKTGLSGEERENHPARYCLVELENVQSAAIEIEPIHRVVFGADMDGFLAGFTAWLEREGAEGGLKTEDGMDEGSDCQRFVFVQGGEEYAALLDRPVKPLAVGTLEAFLDEYMAANPALKVDYVHGEQAVRDLSAEGAVGILLPELEKSDLFRGVAQGGVLPRKTFSMGHAEQKRYYMECRRITAE